MIFHETRLLADDSHEILYLMFSKIRNMLSAAVMIGALRVNSCEYDQEMLCSYRLQINPRHHEEETLKIDTHITIKAKQPAIFSKYRNPLSVPYNWKICFFLSNQIRQTHWKG